MPPSGNDRVLSYGDVLLRRSDVELLEGPHWLNDQIIAFYFEYLARDAFPQLGATAALLPPSAAFLLANSNGPAESEALLGPLALRSKALAVLPVNDNPDVAAAGGGTHWSLLAFVRSENKFLHFDSAAAAGGGGGGGGGGASDEAARMLAGAASPLVRDRDATSSGGSAALPAFERVSYAPRQANGHDCGVYVMAVARALCEWHAGGGKSDMRELLGRITPAAVKDLRREARALIDTLAAAERAAGGGG